MHLTSEALLCDHESVMRFKLIQYCFSLGLAAALLGCTSMQFSEYDQAIRVQTASPGAEIFSGKNKLGTTPAFVRVPKSRAPSLWLKYPDQAAKKVKIKTRYRWTESLLPSLLLGALAPVAAGVDLLTGTAWELEDLENVTLDGRAPLLGEHRARFIAIAPPQAEDQEISDWAGPLLEAEIAKMPLVKVLSFDSTIGVFEDFQFTFDNPISGRPRVELFSDLKTTHIVESQVTKDSPRKIKYRIVNVYSEKVEGEGEIEENPPDRGYGLRLRSLLSGLIPNAISVDAASHWLQIDRENRPIHKVSAEPLAGWMGQASKFLGSIGVSNIIPPRGQREFEPHIRFVSTASFQASEYHIQFEDIGPTESKVRYYRMMVAVGPQFYLETKLGVFYFEALGGMGYSVLKWSTPQNHGELGRGSVASALGLGYYRYISNRLAIKAFFRGVGEDLRNWDWALDQSFKQDVRTTSIQSAEAGLSLLFYFPEVGRRLRK